MNTILTELMYPILGFAVEVSTLLYCVIAVLIITNAVAFAIIKKRSVQLKDANRKLEIFKSFPGRVGVCDRRGDILFLHTENDVALIRDVHNIRDLKYVNAKEIMAAILTAFNTREPKTLEFEQKSNKRAMIISPLDEKIFDKETVVWFSHDNTELYDARKQAEHFAEQNRKNLAKLRQTTRLWNIVINTLPLQIFAKDANSDFKYVFVNKKFREFIGKSESDIIGKTDFEIFPESLARSLREEDKLNVDNLEEGLGNVRCAVSADGTARKLRSMTYPFQDGAGGVLLLGACVDVTEIESLIKNEKLTNFALEQTALESDLSKNFDKIFPIIKDNLNCDFVSIYRKDKITSETTPVWQSQGFDEQYHAAFSEIFASNKESEDETETRKFSSKESDQNLALIKSAYHTPIYIGEEIWGVLAIGWFNEDGNLNREDKKLLESMANIVALSNLRHIQNIELIKNAEEKLKATQNKNFFIASLSHEIRTAMNAIVGFAELMRDKDENKEFADSIDIACNALTHILNNALEYSKLEADEFKLFVEPTNLDDLATTALLPYKKASKTKGVDFEIDFANIPNVLVDKLRLSQIIANIADNTLKLVENGKVKISATFEKSEESKGVLSIESTATGAELAEESLTEILEPFGGKRDITSPSKFAGLELPLVKLFAEKNGGAMDIENDENNFIKIKMTLPNVEVVEIEKRDFESSKETESEEKSEVSSALIVDDAEMNLQIMKAVCEKIGVKNVETASDAKAALELLSEKKFDVVITDLWMPEINGEEFSRKIRNLPSADNTKIIGLTADIEAQTNFDESVFDSMLIKPISPHTLKNALIKTKNSTPDIEKNVDMP